MRPIELCFYVRGSHFTHISLLLLLKWLFTITLLYAAWWHTCVASSFRFADVREMLVLERRFFLHSVYRPSPSFLPPGCTKHLILWIMYEKCDLERFEMSFQCVSTALHLVVALCSGFRSMPESNRNFISVFRRYSFCWPRSTRPLGSFYWQLYTVRSISQLALSRTANAFSKAKSL